MDRMQFALVVLVAVAVRTVIPAVVVEEEDIPAVLEDITLETMVAVVVVVPTTMEPTK
jgi:hypothetical protein